MGIYTTYPTVYPLRYMRFKNFSNSPIEYDRPQVWIHPDIPGSFVKLTEKCLIEPGEVTADFDENDPIVQVMLKAHPELRTYVTPSVWDRIRASQR